MIADIPQTGGSDEVWYNAGDGHYYLWAPLHFYARVTGGVIADPAVRDVVNYLTGAKPLPDRNTDAIGALKRGGLVPRCAMRVTRAKEGGGQSPLAPRPSCGCYFESAVPSGGAPGCKVCNLDSDCPREKPSCNFGYCEVQ